MNLDKTNKVIDKYNAKLTLEAKKNLSSSTASGSLVKSLKISDKPSKTGFNVIISMESYGEYVDQGRKPGKGVPQGVLEKWIRTRNMVITDSNGNTVKRTDANVKGLAYVINRKIKEEGIKPTYFLSEPLDDMLPKFAEDVADAWGDDILEDIADDLFED